MKSILSMLLLALTPLLAFSQSVTLPTEVRGSRGAWIIVAPTKIDGGVPKWKWDPALQEVDLSSLFPSEYTKQMRGKVFTSQVDGRFAVFCWNAKGDVASDMATCWLIVGTPGPTPPVPPIPPIPPDPGPNPPIPPTPTPGDLGPFGGAVGLHVLIVYESASPLTKGQFTTIYGKDFRDYIEAKAAKGPDGKTPQRRIYDQNAPLTNESKLWQDAMARKRASVPWIAVGNGAVWVEAPLPMTVDETMALIKKVGG